MKIKINIIGMGNIGRRHLQAVCRLKHIDKILCCDINQDSLNETLTFCRENALSSERLELTKDFQSVLKAVDTDTIVIVATTASERHQLLREILKQKPRAILAEKPLCQNIHQFEEIMEISKTNNVPIYINFARHMYDVYRDVDKLIKKPGQASLIAHFSGGMACNGIHLLELATWLLKAKTYRIARSQKGRVFETKRKGFYDFSGELAVEFDDDSKCFLTAVEEKQPCAIEISCPGNRFEIHEDDKKMIYLNGTGQTRTINIEVPYVSQLTDTAIDRLIDDKIPGLPDIHQSLMAHQILFEYMKQNDLEHVNIT